MPVRFNYLQYLLKLNENELLWKVFEAQCRSPVKGDWILKVKEDLVKLNLPTDFNEIKGMTKNAFKKLVKEKVNVLALKYLNNIKDKHSKMTNLNYEKIEIQSYMSSKNIFPQLSKQIFKWRTRMMNFKMNFQNGSAELLCPLGCPEYDSQDLILHCSVLKSHLPELQSTKIQYKDIFSKNIDKIKKAAVLLDKVFKKREKLIEIEKLFIIIKSSSA